MNLKRLFVVTAAAVAVWALGVVAQGVPCIANGNLVVFCDWGGPGCWQLTTGPGNPETSASCEQQATYCSANLYTGGNEGPGTCSSISGMAPFSNVGVTWSVQGGLVNCSYGPYNPGPPESGGCFPKTAEECARTSGTPVSSCDDDVQEYFCIYGGKCEKIANPDAMNADNPGMTEREVCEMYGANKTLYTGLANCQAAIGTGPAKFKDFGPCIGGSGWTCEDGGCYSISDAEDEAECQASPYCEVVSVCPAGHAPPAATSIKHLSPKAQSNSAIRASYTKGKVSVNWNAASKISSGKISLVNARGVTVASSRAKISGGRVSANLGAKAVPAGMYFIRINAKDASGKQIIQQTPVSVVK